MPRFPPLRHAPRPLLARMNGVVSMRSVASRYTRGASFSCPKSCDRPSHVVAPFVLGCAAPETLDDILHIIIMYIYIYIYRERERGRDVPICTRLRPTARPKETRRRRARYEAYYGINTYSNKCKCNNTLTNVYICIYNVCMHVYIYIYICIVHCFIYTVIYVYVYMHMYICICIYVYIYIERYTYIYIERERDVYICICQYLYEKGRPASARDRSGRGT